MRDRPRTPDSHVVRRLTSDRTHVMVVLEVTQRQMFGADYWAPDSGLAACGVMIKDAVVMQPGVVTTCRPCVHITGITEEA